VTFLVTFVTPQCDISSWKNHSHESRLRLKNVHVTLCQPQLECHKLFFIMMSLDMLYYSENEFINSQAYS